MNDAQIAGIAMNIAQRDMEIEFYQSNIDAYTFVKTTLPDTAWPEDLKPFKNMSSLDAAKFSPEGNLNQVLLLLRRDQILLSLVTETFEQDKARALRGAFAAQLPADQLDALVATARSQLEAQIAAQIEASRPQ